MASNVMCTCMHVQLFKRVADELASQDHLEWAPGNWSFVCLTHTPTAVEWFELCDVVVSAVTPQELQSVGIPLCELVQGAGWEPTGVGPSLCRLVWVRDCQQLLSRAYRVWILAVVNRYWRCESRLSFAFCAPPAALVRFSYTTYASGRRIVIHRGNSTTIWTFLQPFSNNTWLLMFGCTVLVALVVVWLESPWAQPGGSGTQGSGMSDPLLTWLWNK